MGPGARGKGLTSDPVAGLRQVAMTQGAGARPSGCRSTETVLADEVPARDLIP